MDATASVLFRKTRQAVLALLFEQPARRFYLRELARLTGISTGALQNELSALGRADLVDRSRDGNRVTYRANAAHPVFGELQAIVHKTCGLPGLLRQAIEPLASQIDFAAVYGSVAKGVDHARSDVDLLIVGHVGLDRATAAVAPVEERIDREVSLRVLSLAEFRRRRKGGDVFLDRLMSGPLTIILGEPPSA